MLFLTSLLKLFDCSCKRKATDDKSCSDEITKNKIQKTTELLLPTLECTENQDLDFFNRNLDLFENFCDEPFSLETFDIECVEENFNYQNGSDFGSFDIAEYLVQETDENEKNITSDIEDLSTETLNEKSMTEDILNSNPCELRRSSRKSKKNIQFPKVLKVEDKKRKGKRSPQKRLTKTFRRINDDENTEDYFYKIIEETEAFSLDIGERFKFSKEITDFLGEDILNNLIDVETTSLFRFYAYIKLVYGLKGGKIKIFQSIGRFSLRENILSFLKEYIICDCPIHPNLKGLKVNKNTNNHFIIEVKDLNFEIILENFNDDLVKAFRKYIPFFISTNKNFTVGSLLNIMINSKIIQKKLLQLAIEKPFEKNEFSYILFLFPEIKYILEFIKRKSLNTFKLKVLFNTIGFVIIKSKLLKNKLFEEIQTTRTTNSVYNFYDSKFFCKYILDIKYTLFVSVQIVSTNKVFNEKIKNTFLSFVFLSFLRVNYPEVLNFYKIFECFYSFEDLKNAFTNEILQTTKEICERTRRFDVLQIHSLSYHTIGGFLNKLNRRSMCLFQTTSNLFTAESKEQENEIIQEKLNDFTKELLKSLED